MKDRELTEQKGKRQTTPAEGTACVEHLEMRTHKSSVGATEPLRIAGRTSVGGLLRMLD